MDENSVVTTGSNDTVPNGWTVQKAPIVAKGKLISITGVSADGNTSENAEKFRVIKVNGDEVELLAMSGLSKEYDNSGETTEFTNGSSYLQYKGSDLDNYLDGSGNADYYGLLPGKVKNAIVPQKITQPAYEYSNDAPTSYDYSYQNSWMEDMDYATKVGIASADGEYERRVYTLDLEDIFEYVGKRDISSNELNEMFFGQKTIVVRFCWLRSAGTDDSSYACVVGGVFGGLGSGNYDDNLEEARAAFTIDLSQVDWQVVE